MPHNTDCLENLLLFVNAAKALGVPTKGCVSALPACRFLSAIACGLSSHSAVRASRAVLLLAVVVVVVCRVSLCSVTADVLFHATESEENAQAATDLLHSMIKHQLGSDAEHHLKDPVLAPVMVRD